MRRVSLSLESPESSYLSFRSDVMWLYCFRFVPDDALRITLCNLQTASKLCYQKLGCKRSASAQAPLQLKRAEMFPERCLTDPVLKVLRCIKPLCPLKVPAGRGRRSGGKAGLAEGGDVGKGPGREQRPALAQSEEGGMLPNPHDAIVADRCRCR